MYLAVWYMYIFLLFCTIRNTNYKKAQNQLFLYIVTKFNLFMIQNALKRLHISFSYCLDNVRQQKCKS